MIASINLFARLRELLPLPSVIVGEVKEIHDDDTSTVEIPGSLPVTDYASNVATGSLIRARGTSVPVGSNAFVRAGVIESQAPDGVAVEVPIGTVALPPAPPPVTPPAPSPSPSASLLAEDDSGLLTESADNLLTE